MKNRSIFKVLSVLSFVVSFLAGSALIPYFTKVSAVATQQPIYSLNVRNVTDNQTFDGNPTSVSLDAGEVAQLRMQIGNLAEGNDINSLRLKAFFTDSINPTEFHADIKADNLDWIGGVVNVQVPAGYYLQYVPGTTVLDVDDRPEFRTRTVIPDVNGTSVLAFNNGYELTNIKAGPHTWLWVHFKVKAVQNQPVVINPRLDLEKVVVNVTDGETLKEDRTSTTAGPGDVVMVQITVKNGVAQSTLHNVVLKDQAPSGNATPQVLIATAASKEASASRKITISITDTQEINLVRGSVVLKDMFGNTLKTLSDDEVNQLFSSGLSLGDIDGTFEHAKVIEYKAKVSEVKAEPPVRELPVTGSGLSLLGLLISIPAGIALKRFRLKV